jgi:hypothetical protein
LILNSPDTPVPSQEAYLGKLRRLASLQDEKERRHQERLHEARSDFKSFLEYVMKDEATGLKIILAEIHLSWLDHIYFAWSHGLHAVILAPYGSGKSAIMSIGVPLFCFGVDPSLRITVISANDTIAQERLVLIRQYIDHSEEYQELFPNVRSDPNKGWTQKRLFLERLTFSKDPSLSASGAIGSIIGKRNDLLIFDDINDAKNTIQQPKSREIIWTKYTGEYISRLEPGSKILMISTKWHEKDLVGNIMADPNMRRAYAFLTQRVSADFMSIECETIIPALMPAKVESRLELAHLFNMHKKGII